MTLASSDITPLRNDWQNRRIGLDAFCPAVQFMADATEAWCRRVYGNKPLGRLIVLSGTFGCGKTECLRAARRYVRDVRQAIWPQPWKAPLCVESVNFADFIREQVENDNREQWEDVTGADVLFMDDVGSEEDRFKSGSPTRILGDLLGKMEGRFVFITTNIAPNGWRQRWDARVEDRLLRSNSEIVNLWKPELRAESYAAFNLRRRVG